jgi:hypothetical protein
MKIQHVLDRYACYVFEVGMGLLYIGSQLRVFRNDVY